LESFVLGQPSEQCQDELNSQQEQAQDQGQGVQETKGSGKLIDEDLFDKELVRGLFERAALAEAHRMSYKETVGTGMMLLPEGSRTEVSERLKEMKIEYIDEQSDVEFDGQVFYVARGAQAVNRFFHLEKKSERGQPVWLLKAACDTMFSADHIDDLDEPVFAQKSSVAELAGVDSYSITKSSFVGMGSVMCSEKFDEIETDVAKLAHSQPDEQRYRALIMTVGHVFSLHTRSLIDLQRRITVTRGGRGNTFGKTVITYHACVVGTDTGIARPDGCQPEYLDGL
jgi:hypothetical protein